MINFLIAFTAFMMGAVVGFHVGWQERGDRERRAGRLR